MLIFTMDALPGMMIMVTNYSHDIATAFLAVSGLTMWLISRQHFVSESPEQELFFIRIYKGITRIAKDSLYWILLAGVPRVVFYMEYEWSDVAGRLQIVAIVIKHVVMFTLVGAGLFFWSRLSRRVKVLKLKHNLIS
ncbi:MAG: hypothetical protein HZA17_12360 [Nitrospirae bacterium]|nr:hypothetical protein [Nitrospirota bacterium]